MGAEVGSIEGDSVGKLEGATESVGCIDGALEPVGCALSVGA